jgi:hypothetical protein
MKRTASSDLSAIRLASDTIAVTVHFWPIARLVSVKWCHSRRTGIITPRIIGPGLRRVFAFKTASQIDARPKRSGDLVAEINPAESQSRRTNQKRHKRNTPLRRLAMAPKIVTTSALSLTKFRITMLHDFRNLGQRA